KAFPDSDRRVVVVQSVPVSADAESNQQACGSHDAVHVSRNIEALWGGGARVDVLLLVVARRSVAEDDRQGVVDSILFRIGEARVVRIRLGPRRLWTLGPGDAPGNKEDVGELGSN